MRTRNAGSFHGAFAEANNFNAFWGPTTPWLAIAVSSGPRVGCLFLSLRMSSAKTIVAHPHQRRWRWAGFAVFIVVALLLAWAARTIGLRELMDRLLAQLRDLGAPVFFTAMALLPAVGFPLLPFALTAGPAFSPALGTGGVIAYAILAVAVNVSLSYLLASVLFRPPVQWLVRRLGYNLPDPTRRSPWLVTLLVRIAPGPPFWLQSYVLGLVRVRFAAYLIVSTAVPAGYLSGAILFGDAMLHGKTGAAFFAVGLIFLAGTGVYFLRRKLISKSAPLPL